MRACVRACGACVRACVCLCVCVSQSESLSYLCPDLQGPHTHTNTHCADTPYLLINKCQLQSIAYLVYLENGAPELRHS